MKSLRQGASSRWCVEDMPCRNTFSATLWLHVPRAAVLPHFCFCPSFGILGFVTEPMLRVLLETTQRLKMLVFQLFFSDCCNILIRKRRGIDFVQTGSSRCRCSVSEAGWQASLHNSVLWSFAIGMLHVQTLKCLDSSAHESSSEDYTTFVHCADLGTCSTLSPVLGP